MHALCILGIACLLVLEASGRVLERVERDSLGRVLLFFSEAPEGWYSDLSADKRRILLTFPHCTPAPTVRSRSWVEGTVREAYLKQDSTNLRIFLSLAAPQGYSAVWLPLSCCLLVTPIRWDTLPPSEDLYHSALLALELRADTVADSLLTEAALRGSSNAAALLAVRALSRGHASTALRWLRQAFGRSSLPDYYAVIAYTAEFTGDARLQAWAQTRFQALTQRELPPPPLLSPDSLAVLIDAALSWPLADTLLLVPSPPATTVAVVVDSSAVAPSSPPQQRAPEWLLTAAPAFFGLFGAAIVFLILRHLSYAARRRAADSLKNETQSPAPPFPGYIHIALQHYAAAESQRQSQVDTDAASIHRLDMSHGEQSPDTGIATTDLPEPPVNEHRTSHRLPSPLVELWRQRLRYRSQYLRDVLQQLQSESIPESTVGRARLARRLQIPQEGLELHLRLTAASSAPAAQRTQDSPSFVSTAVSRVPDGGVE